MQYLIFIFLDKKFINIYTFKGKMVDSLKITEFHPWNSTCLGNSVILIKDNDALSTGNFALYQLVNKF